MVRLQRDPETVSHKFLLLYDTDEVVSSTKGQVRNKLNKGMETHVHTCADRTKAVGAS